MSDVDSSRAADAAKSLVRKFRDVVHGYESCEILVREATANNSDAPTPAQLQAIAYESGQFASYPRLFAQLWKRITDLAFKRHVLKALIVLEHIMRVAPASPSVQLRLAIDVRQNWRDIYRLAMLRGGSSTSNIVREIQQIAERLCNWICDFEQGKTEQQQISTQQHDEQNGMDGVSHADLLPVNNIPDWQQTSSIASTNVSPPSSPSGASRELGFDMISTDKNLASSDEDSRDDTWQCTSCTFVNKAETTICDICGKSRKWQSDEEENLLAVPEEGWTCDRCSFVNKQDTNICAVCESARAPDSDQDESDIAAKLAQPSTAIPSSSSATPSPQQVRSPPQPQAAMSMHVNTPRKADLLSRGGWSCSWCLYLNKPTSMYCEVCDKERKASQHANVVKLQYANKRRDEDRSWSCKVCTFVNPADSFACAICEHRRDGDPMSTISQHQRAHTMASVAAAAMAQQVQQSPSLHSASVPGSPAQVMRQPSQLDQRPAPLSIVADPQVNKTVLGVAPPARAQTLSTSSSSLPQLQSSHSRTPSNYTLPSASMQKQLSDTSLPASPTSAKRS